MSCVEHPLPRLLVHAPLVSFLAQGSLCGRLPSPLVFPGRSLGQHEPVQRPRGHLVSGLLARLSCHALRTELRGSRAGPLDLAKVDPVGAPRRIFTGAKASAFLSASTFKILARPTDLKPQRRAGSVHQRVLWFAQHPGRGRLDVLHGMVAH
jgi:hypothetical protein